MVTASRATTARRKSSRARKASARMSAVHRTRARKTAAKNKTAARNVSKKASKNSAKTWSARVTQSSDALDLKQDVFTLDSPNAIARSLKRSAEQSHRRKSDPYRSAMSMLVFYINHAGTNLSVARRKKLEAAKDELRKVFGRAA